jgi:hypothetical protein|nr:MAG TPA: hypothetical protein [Caudoviricetes sp.]
MEHIRLFDTQINYDNEKESIPTPSVTLVEEPHQVIYEPISEVTEPSE